MTWACFLPCYWGQIPSDQLAVGSQKETEICLRSFGQIARRRPGSFLETDSTCSRKGQFLGRLRGVLRCGNRTRYGP